MDFPETLGVSLPKHYLWGVQVALIWPDTVFEKVDGTVPNILVYKDPLAFTNLPFGNCAMNLFWP